MNIETRFAVSEAIESSSKASALQWEGAIEGAERDGHDPDPVERASSDCANHYQAALYAIERNDTDGAIAALQWAQELEREYGDDAPAKSALAIVRGTANGDRVLLETMPDHLRESHRAAGNWGRYPVNGATRAMVDRAEAMESVASDPDKYSRIIE